jgi:hypothetical protein
MHVEWRHENGNLKPQIPEIFLLLSLLNNHNLTIGWRIDQSVIGFEVPYRQPEEKENEYIKYKGCDEEYPFEQDMILKTESYSDIKDEQDKKSIY